MNADSAEVVAEAIFHPSTRRSIERLARCSQYMVHNAWRHGGRSYANTLAVHALLASLALTAAGRMVSTRAFPPQYADSRNGGRCRRDGQVGGSLGHACS
jgi:hypothetical protein